MVDALRGKGRICKGLSKAFALGVRSRMGALMRGLRAGRMHRVARRAVLSGPSLRLAPSPTLNFFSPSAFVRM